jgi:hypothetical protein
MWVEITQSVYSDLLRAGRSGDQIPAVARFATPVQTGPGAHVASCTMGTGVSFSVVILPVHGVDHLLTFRAIPLLPLWSLWPVTEWTCHNDTFWSGGISPSILELKIKHCARSYSNPSNLNIGRIDCLSCRADLKVLAEIKCGFQFMFN